MRRILISIAIALLAPCAGLRAQAPPQGEAGKKIGSLTFEGRRALSRSVLADSLVTKGSHCRGLLAMPICAVSHTGLFYETHTLDPAELPRDELRIRVMYFRKGYRETRVSSRVTPKGDDQVDVTLTIDEGPLTKIRSIAVSPTRPVLTPQQLGRMGLPTAGGPLDLTLLDSATIRIQNALWDHGYADAAVLDSTAIDSVAHAADVRLVVDTKHLTVIDTIEIGGNERVSDYTVSRLLDLHPGQIFRRTDVTAAQRRLFETEIFRQSVVRVPPTADSAKRLQVDVREAPLRSLRLGAGINTTEFAQTEARFVRYNWLGGARRLDMRAAVGNLLATQLNGVSIFTDVAETSFGGEVDPVFLRPTWQVGAQLTQPFFLSPRTSLGLGVSAHRRVVPGIVVDKGAALDASVTRRAREGIPISLVYHFERADVEAGDVYFCASFGVCDPPTIAALRRPYRLSPIGVSARVELADDPIAPTQGTLAQLDISHASRLTGSSFQYQRIAGEASHYYRLPGRHSVIAGVIRGGWVRALEGTFAALGIDEGDLGVLHPRERFLSGGARSIRGYGENQMGPKVLTVPAHYLIRPPTDTGTPPCTLQTIANHTCDPNAAPDSVFTSRPLGGNTLLEGSLEYRFPVTQTFMGAVFVDAGILRGQAINFPPGSRSAVTPGFGVRYQSPIGPVRIDLGIKTKTIDTLPVVTEIIDPSGEQRLIQLRTLKVWDPASGSSGVGQLFQRLQLHLAIGEAFWSPRRRIIVKRGAGWLARTLVGVVILALIVVWVMTQTDFGRNKLRLYGLRQLAERVHGIVRIGEVHGDLLTGARLVDVVITDSAGGPFLRADTIELRYSRKALFQKHIVFQDVRLVNANVVFDEPPPGGVWNVERLFKGDTVVASGDTIPGWGDWVRFEGVQVVNGNVLVRRAWSPPDTLKGDALDRAITEALSDRNRILVERVAGGYQAVSSFREVYGGFPLIRFADPDSVPRIVDVDSLRMLALPFRPPAAEVKTMVGRLVVGADSIAFDQVRVQLPASTLQVDGTMSFGNATGAAIRLQGNPVELSDLRFLRPSLPAGGGRADFTIHQTDESTRLTARRLDLKVEGATLQGTADIESGRSGVRVHGSDLTFAHLDTRVVERLAEGVNVPLDGVLTGRLKLAGVADDLTLDGAVDVEERGGAVSRIYARGGIRSGPYGQVAEKLQLRFDPLRLSLVKQAGAKVPVGGALTGTATLDGPLSSVMTVDADLTHEDATAGRSHVRARGGVRVQGAIEARALRLELEPLQAKLVKVFDPTFPLGGTFMGSATVSGMLASWLSVNADLTHADPAAGRSHVLARGDVKLRGGVAARALRLDLDPLQAKLVKAFDPTFPLGGTLEGRATLTGSAASWLTVDADLTHDEARIGRSRVAAVGEVRTQGGFQARQLRLRFDPLQTALVREFSPTFKPDGVVVGTAVVNGAPASTITSTLDLTHRGSTGLSTVAGDARVSVRNRVTSFDVDLRARPLSLATVGLFAPQAGLQGSVTGPIRAQGTTTSAAFDAALDVTGGGRIVARGTFGTGAGPNAPARYDVVADVSGFDAGAVTTRAPTTSFTGSVTANGVGTDPATMSGFVDAELVDSRVAGRPRVDSTRMRARFDRGLLSVERGVVRLANARADVVGSFGLVEGRTGELRYTVTADSLAHFKEQVRQYTGADSTFVRVRPLAQQREVGRARADSIRVVDRNLVERMATGSQTVPVVVLDTVSQTLRHDSIGGSVNAQGVLVGSIHRFDARGTADLKDFVYNGSYVGTGRVEYDLAQVPTAQMCVDLDAHLARVRTGGFAFDSATALVRHTGGRQEGSGTVELALFQDPARDYRLKSEYTLALDRQELRLHDVNLRFDSTRWTSTQSGVVRWADDAIELERIELVNGKGGRIFADGRLPREGSGDLTVRIDSLQIADFAALVQDTLVTRGLLSVNGTFHGTATAPELKGTLSLDQAAKDGQTLPSLRGTFDYANLRLTGHVEAQDGPRRLLTAEGQLPVNLAFRGVTGPRLLDGPISLDVQADSFPLETLPQISPEVQNLSGRLRGTVTVRGTRADPTLGGQLALNGGAASLPTTGLDLRDARGVFRLADDVLTVDTMTVSSGGGPIDVKGTVGFATLTNPEFELSVTAKDAQLLASGTRKEYVPGEIHGDLRGDVSVTVGGSLEALRLIGEVSVTGGVIDVPEPANIMQRATRLDDPQLVGVYESLGVPDALRPRNRLLETTELDLVVHVARDTWLRNSVMNVEVYTPDDEDALRVTIDHATRRYALEGVIHAERGDYTFAGREFKLSTGSVTFLPEQSDPILQLSARHEVPRRTRETLVILVDVSGTLKAPKVTLSSNVQPPIPESDLLSFLAFGEESSALLTREGSGIAGDALGSLGLLAEQQLSALALGSIIQGFVSNIEREGTRAGLDVFRVRPRAIPDELNFGSYFTNFFQTIDIQAGKYLTPQLFVAVEGTPSGQTLPGLRVEYLTARGFSWITTWETGFKPVFPTLDVLTAQPVRVFGSFLTWQRRF